MTQFDLTVATRGSHAALLPVLLIATSINEARPTPVINLKYEDTALLNEGDKAILQLSTAGKSVFGAIPAIQELCTHFPYLVGKDATVVSYPYLRQPRHNIFPVWSHTYLTSFSYLGERVDLPAGHPDYSRFQGS